MLCVNLACGDSYVTGWRNYDYSVHSAEVTRANLLGRLPLGDGDADVVYCSHFLEHVPYVCVASFVAECFRITKPGGRIRLVLPDLEELCQSYLMYRQAGEHDKADFLVLEMVDQCVRTTPGGRLGEYYGVLQSSDASDDAVKQFVRERTGHVVRKTGAMSAGSRWSRAFNNPSSIFSKLEHLYVQAVLQLLPRAFRQQNVSLSSVGERHVWMYDFHTVSDLLLQAGFGDVQRLSATVSNIADFPSYPLDIDADGRPRKGAESMYVEAVRS